MAGEKLSLEQFTVLLKNIDSSLGPAASQLWKEGVNTEALLRTLTKQDMHMAGINLGNRILVYEHFHRRDAGRYELCVILGIVRTYRWLVLPLLYHCFHEAVVLSNSVGISRHGRKLKFWCTTTD